MKVTQEKLPASQVGLEIEIPAEKSKQAYEQVIQKFTRQANIPGFRKGKVPRQVIVQRFGSTSLKAAALEDLIDESLKAAIEQEKIEALGNFELRSSFEELVAQFEPGAPLIFSASVDVQPEVTLKQYSGLGVQAEEVLPDLKKVEDTIAEYREETATLIPVEGRAAQLGDVAVIDFKGMLVSDDPEAEPEPVPGGQAEDFQVELDEDRFIPGFILGIVGMEPGEVKEVTAKFPESYPQEAVAGRDAVFTVTLKELKTKELPELDDDFAQEVSEFETLADLRDSLEKRVTEEAEAKTRENKEQALLNELLNQIEVDLPETLIDREVSYMLNQTAVQLQNQGIDIKRLFNQETIAVMKERSRPDAINRIKRTLALGEIAKREEIATDEAAIDAKVTEILTDLDDRSIDRDRLRSVIAEDMLKEKIMDWLIEHSTIELVPEGSLQPAEPEEAAETDAESEMAPEATGLLSEAEAVEAVAEAVTEPAANEAPETITVEAAVVEATLEPEPGETVESSGAESPKPSGKAKEKSKGQP
jgi:trigger factor